MAAANLAGGTTPYVVSTDELAAILGKADRTIRHWAKTTDIPKAGRNKWDLTKVVIWVIEHEIAERLPASGDGRRLLAAQADEREQRAKLILMRTRKMAGELVEADEVERGLIERIIQVKAALKHLAGKLGTQLVGSADRLEVEQVIIKEVDECLGRFANGDEQKEADRALIEKIAGRLAGKIAKKKFSSERAAAKAIIKILGEDKNF